MKFFFKKLIAFVVTAFILVSICSINCFAQTVGKSTVRSDKTTIKKGDTVTVIITVTAHSSDNMIYNTDGKVTFTKSVLEYDSCTANSSNLIGGNVIKFSHSGSQKSSTSISFTFKAIASGTSTISLGDCYYYGDKDNSMYSVTGQSISIKVAEPSVTSNTVSSKPITSNNNSKPTSSKTSETKPSTNANLSALTLTGGTLTPEFNRNTTEYTVTVENSVATTEITATAADRNAKITGTGAVNLEVGDNEHSIVVTAADKKTTKTYKLKIRRATVEETLALNPTATVINGEMHHLKTDISEIPVPNGYKADTAVYNGIDVGVFKSEDEKYTLYPITNATTNVTEYYTYKALRDEFVPLKYVTIGGNMYILLDYPESYVIPKGYFETAVQIGDKTVNALCSENESLKDIYFLYCYQGGAEQFFSYDVTDASIQRSPDLTVKMDEQASIPTGIKGIVYKFRSLDRTVKILILALAVCVVIIIVLTVLLLTSKRGRYKGRRIANLFEDDEELNTFLSIDDSVFQSAEEKTEEE